MFIQPNYSYFSFIYICRYTLYLYKIFIYQDQLPYRYKSIKIILIILHSITFNDNECKLNEAIFAQVLKPWNRIGDKKKLWILLLANQYRDMAR